MQYKLNTAYQLPPACLTLPPDVFLIAPGITSTGSRRFLGCLQNEGAAAVNVTFKEISGLLLRHMLPLYGGGFAVAALQVPGLCFRHS